MKRNNAASILQILLDGYEVTIKDHTYKLARTEDYLYTKRDGQQMGAVHTDLFLKYQDQEGNPVYLGSGITLGVFIDMIEDLSVEDYTAIMMNYALNESKER